MIAPYDRPKVTAFLTTKTEAKHTEVSNKAIARRKSNPQA
jgi:hypothetical protein